MIVINEKYIEARSCDVKISSSNQTSHGFLRESLKKAHSFFHTITLVGSLWKQNSCNILSTCPNCRTARPTGNPIERIEVYSIYFISSNHSCESSCSQVTISGTSRWIYKWQVKALQWNCMQDFNIQQKVIGHVCVCVLLCCSFRGLPLSIKTVFTFCPKISKHPRHQKFGSLTSWFRIWGCSLGFTWVHPAIIITSQALITSNVPNMFLRISRKAFEPIGTCSSSVHLASCLFEAFFWSCFAKFLPFTVKKLGLLEEPSDP